jgi:hypothetical protein
MTTVSRALWYSLVNGRFERLPGLMVIGETQQEFLPYEDGPLPDTVQAFVDGGGTIAPWAVEDACDLIDRERDRLIDAGVTVGGKTIQTRPEDIANIAAKTIEALACLSGALSWDADFAWIAADNTLLPLPTPADMIGLGATASAHKTNLIFQGAALKARLRGGEVLDPLDPVLWDA